MINLNKININKLNQSLLSIIPLLEKEQSVLVITNNPKDIYNRLKFYGLETFFKPNYVTIKNIKKQSGYIFSIKQL